MVPSDLLQRRVRVLAVMDGFGQYFLLRGSVAPATVSSLAHPSSQPACESKCWLGLGKGLLPYGGAIHRTR